MKKAIHSPEVTRNRREMLKRERRLRQFGYARLYAQHAGVEGKITFVLQDAAKLPWAGKTFDAVVTMNAMHHIPHFQQVLEEMVRVTRPGGKILLADFSPRGFQIVARSHRAEGRVHPRAHHDFRQLGRQLRERGLATCLFKGCHQEILLARLPAQIEPR
jgi:ubiquinone/menaquinone biosynthesis C-methylase UbiE